VKDAISPALISHLCFLNSFEQWVIRIVVNNTPRPISNDSAAVIERQRIQVCRHVVLSVVYLVNVNLTLVLALTLSFFD
jgi:hypothetical protein